MKKQITFALALIAVLVLATGSAAAKATQREFTGYYFNCGPRGDPERMWTTGDGQVLHVRGAPNFGYARSDNDLYNAYTETVGNFDLNQVTGSGSLRATFIKYVDVGGTWEGVGAGPFVDFLAYLSVAGHGTGELAGMKYFARFAPTVEHPGFVDPCPGGAADVSFVTGVILDTR
jgi:hypothetical protein